MNRERLRQILVERSLLIRQPHDEPFTLSSGEESWHYFDLGRTMTFGPALTLIGEAVCNSLDEDVVAVGGPPRGADLLATAAAFYSALHEPTPLNTFSIREKPKPHGISAFLEGSVSPGDVVAVVDDVLTTGKSIIAAIQECWDHDLRVACVVALVDRGEGGLEAVRDYLGRNAVRVLYHCSELLAEK